MISPELLAILQKLRTKVAIGTVGGSDLVKQQEQLGMNGANGGCWDVRCCAVEGS